MYEGGKFEDLGSDITSSGDGKIIECGTTGWVLNKTAKWGILMEKTQLKAVFSFKFKVDF